MRKRKSSAIINISSLGALTCNGGSGYYSASKSALEKMSISLRDEVEPLEIKVMIVEPGLLEQILGFHIFLVKIEV